MSKVLVDRDRVVESMCLTWRHDFGLDKLEGCDFCSGMTDKEREHLRGQMGKLFDHHFAPALSAVTAERDRIENELEETELRALKFFHRFSAATDLGRELREALELIEKSADGEQCRQIAYDALEPFRARAAMAAKEA